MSEAQQLAPTIEHREILVELGSAVVDVIEARPGGGVAAAHE